MKPNLNQKIPYFKFLLGIWAIGIGIKMLYMLLKGRATGQAVIIPPHPVNILFDFTILTILGVIVWSSGFQEIIQHLYNKEKNETKSKKPLIKQT